MFNQQTRYNDRLLVVISLTTLISACVVSPGMNMQTESGTPINVQNANKLVKMKSTKMDVIELFGMPNTSSGMPQMPAGMSGMPGMPQGNTGIATGSDEIYSYKHCKTGTSDQGFKVITPLDAFKTNTIAVTEQCEQLVVLIGKNEVVKTYAYFGDDPVVQENVGKIVKGKSKKIDVIEDVGSPSAIQVSGNDEVYTYKSCIGSVQSSTFGGIQSKQNCKQLTVILDKSTEVVKGVSFQSYQ